MKITFDPDKRQRTIEERGIDFADAGEVFENYHYQRIDDRRDYGEARYIAVGRLQGQVVVIVWTPREESRRIISMRKANDSEKAVFARHYAKDFGMD